MKEDIEFSDEEVARAVFNIYGKDVIAKLKAQIDSLDKVASGKLLRSLDYKLERFLTSFKFSIEGEDYGINVLQGRKAGKFAPVKALQEWMETKNIDLKYSYAINKSIYKFGIRPANFLEEVITDSSIDELSKQLEENYKTKIENQLEKYFYEK